MSGQILLLTGPPGAGKTVAQEYLHARGFVVAPKFTTRRPMESDAPDAIRSLAEAELRARSDIVYENYASFYGVSTGTLRDLAETSDVVISVSNLFVVREIRQQLPEIKVVWVEGDVSERELMRDRQELGEFRFREKAVARLTFDAEQLYEESSDLVDFKVVNDRTRDWVERQLDAFLLSLLPQTGRDKLYTATLDPHGEPVIAVASKALELRLLAHRPQDLLNLTPREFEEFVAELLAADGYEVELTPETRDGGFDIVALKTRDIVVPQLCLVECKRYGRAKRVGVQPVRQLYGVVSQRNASAGLLVTSGFFTRPALDFQQTVGHRIGLRDYAALQEWLARFR